MKQLLNLIIKACVECPYYQCVPEAGNINCCVYNRAVPFGVADPGRTISDLCKLPDAPPHVRDHIKEFGEKEDKTEYKHEGPPDPVIFQQNGLMASLPPEWFQDMTAEERDQINQREDERIERMLREEGFDPLDLDEKE